MKQFRISDEAAIEYIEAETMAEALETAEENWQDGSWDAKCIVSVRVAELDTDGNETDKVEWVDVECGEDPEAPECTEDDHDFAADVAVVGGLRENPGVWSAGGTTIVSKTCCKHCGIYKKETSYGSQRNPGQCDTVEYIDADESSLAWIAAK